MFGCVLVGDRSVVAIPQRYRCLGATARTKPVVFVAADHL
jgi:hypothetical protein